MEARPKSVRVYRDGGEAHISISEKYIRYEKNTSDESKAELEFWTWKEQTREIEQDDNRSRTHPYTHTVWTLIFISQSD